MAAENIDNTVNGTGLFPAKVPGLADAADIQAALRLYHYGSYSYDGANTNPSNLVNPSIAKHLQNLVDADAEEITNRDAAITSAINTEVTNRNSAISTHNSNTTNVHGIADTSLLATKAYVDNGIDSSTVDQSLLAGTGLDWNSVSEQFDVEPRISNVSTVITKDSSFTIEEADVNKTILLNTSSGMSITVPSNSSIAIPVGYQYNFIEIGTGKTTFTPASDVTIGSKNSQLFLDGQYSKGTLLKVATNTWVLYGDVYEGIATPTPTPVAPTPVAPTPVAPTPVAPTPVAPTPVAPTPVAPTPVAPTPVAPTPVAPTPVAVTCGACESYEVIQPTCNGEDSYEGVYIGTRKTCSDGSYEICTQPVFDHFGSLLQANVPSCGGSGVTPTPVAPTPVAPTPVAPTPVAPTPTNSLCTDYSVLNQSQCSACGGYWSVNFGECSQTPWTSPTPVAPTPVAPTPVAPTPVAPTPVAPTPVAPTPVAPTPTQDCTPVFSYNEYRASCGTTVSIYVNPCTGAESYTCPSPTPVAPTPVAPTPVAPTPVAPTPVAPTPVAPTPVAPTPSAYCYCPYYGYAILCSQYCPSSSPTPVAPTPVAPTPVAPTPVAPTPVAPTPVAPTPVAPAPAGCTGTAQQICVCEGGFWSAGGCFI